MAKTPAVRIPGPPEILPGLPDAVVDLQTDDGAALVDGQWRSTVARIVERDFVGPGDDLGPTGEPNRTYDVEPHAHDTGYDDSGWTMLAPADTMRRLSTGLLCFNWYRIDVTVPERLGAFDTTGSTAVFEVVVDDYAEVWVNGALPLALGRTSGPVVSGFNAPNRVVLGRDVRPGDRFQIAVLGINGPISNPPHNYVWIRSATVDFYAAGRDHPAVEVPSRSTVSIRRSTSSCRSRPASRRWPAGSSSREARCGHPRARCCSAPPTPT